MIITDTTYRDVLREQRRGTIRPIFWLDPLFCALLVVYPHPFTGKRLGHGDPSSLQEAN